MQSLDKSGLNLDPMFYWQWVMKNKSERIVPRVVFRGVPQDVAEELGLNLPNVDILVFDTVPNGCFPIYDNVKLYERNRFTEKQYLQQLSLADYFYSENEKENIEAGLCGVKVLETPDELWKNREKLHVLTVHERIDCWEYWKNLLT